MFLATLLLLITGVLFVIALTLLSIGGVVFGFIGADLIVAIAIIWFLFFRKKKR